MGRNTQERILRNGLLVSRIQRAYYSCIRGKMLNGTRMACTPLAAIDHIYTSSEKTTLLRPRCLVPGNLCQNKGRESGGGDGHPLYIGLRLFTRTNRLWTEANAILPNLTGRHHIPKCVEHDGYSQSCFTISQPKSSIIGMWCRRKRTNTWPTASIAFSDAQHNGFLSQKGGHLLETTQ